MATVTRRAPLVERPFFSVSPLKTIGRTASAPTKRPRSPDPDTNAPITTVKRARPSVPPPTSTVVAREQERKAKEQRRAAREIQRAEFRLRYTKAFPSWSFYFDSDHLDADDSARELFESQISQLGGHVEDFFSSGITHLITNQPPIVEDADKENQGKRNTLRSPVKTKGRTQEASGFDLVEKATSFGIKIWNTSKLESVLERCLSPPTVSQSSRVVAANPPISTQEISRQRSLTRLLESERLHGTTTERDPTQRRHDYRYFSKYSFFVLVEDMRGELATIAALEYPISKGRCGDWPVLHCHPLARGPFIPFDEREKKRYLKSQKVEKERALEKENTQAEMRARRDEKRRQAQLYAKKTGDLRRSVSMNNLHRRDPVFGLDLDANDVYDNPDSANASGYLASTGTGGYIAASGNSVGVTSTVGTTSTGHTLRNMNLPASLRGRIQQQVVTSRKVGLEKASGRQMAGIMGPPVGLPSRPANALLRKSRSTNTLRLEKRKEGEKPGYCESCRSKFDDFKDHVNNKKHRKFAMDDSNYLQLDYVLNRVRRRTLSEMEEENRARDTRRLVDENESSKNSPRHQSFSPSREQMRRR